MSSQSAVATPISLAPGATLAQSPLPKRIIAAKPMANESGDSKSNIQLSTSRVWVLPPRPKPGRKPANDTPPSRRKAQNREAQRAFRERRAAVVGELEDKIASIEKAHTSKLATLRRALADMNRENEQLRKSLSELHLSLAKQHSSYQVASPAPSESMELLDRVLNDKLPVPELSAESNDSSEKCAVCTKDVCLCEVIEIRPSLAVSKRSPDDEREIDFTAQFARPAKIKKIDTAHTTGRLSTGPNMSNPALATAGKSLLGNSTKLESGCGFCSKDTPCVCDESHEESREEPPLIYDIEDNTLPPIISPFTTVSTNRLPALHPGPTREVTSLRSAGLLASPVALATPSTIGTSRRTSSSSSDKCTGDPGSCLQCQRDPMSTLFCSTIASRDTEQETNDGTYISVSAAYQTLSRHKDFRSANFGHLVSKLHTRGMEVEVNSVANVLRQLDRQLYD
jgi:Minimal binding motif of Hap4 for binding to Hap2/3/5